MARQKSEAEKAREAKAKADHAAELKRMNEQAAKRKAERDAKNKQAANGTKGVKPKDEESGEKASDNEKAEKKKPEDSVWDRMVKALKDTAVNFDRSLPNKLITRGNSKNKSDIEEQMDGKKNKKRKTQSDK